MCSGCGCFSFLAWITNKEQNKSNEKKTKNPKKRESQGMPKCWRLKTTPINDGKVPNQFQASPMIRAEEA